VKARSEHPNLRKGRQKRTDARTHARTMFLHKATLARRNRAHSEKEKKKKKKKKRKRKTWLKEKSQKLAL
jgi:hypothetical protein